MGTPCPLRVPCPLSHPCSGASNFPVLLAHIPSSFSHFSLSWSEVKALFPGGFLGWGTLPIPSLLSWSPLQRFLFFLCSQLHLPVTFPSFFSCFPLVWCKDEVLFSMLVSGFLGWGPSLSHPCCPSPTPAWLILVSNEHSGRTWDHQDHWTHQEHWDHWEHRDHQDHREYWDHWDDQEHWDHWDHRSRLTLRSLFPQGTRRRRTPGSWRSPCPTCGTPRPSWALHPRG